MPDAENRLVRVSLLSRSIEVEGGSRQLLISLHLLEGVGDLRDAEQVSRPL